MQGLVLKKFSCHGLDGKMASFVQGPCKDFYHGWPTQVDYYHLDIKYLEPIGTLYII